MAHAPIEAARLRGRSVGPKWPEASWQRRSLSRWALCLFLAALVSPLPAHFSENTWPAVSCVSGRLFLSFSPPPPSRQATGVTADLAAGAGQDVLGSEVGRGGEAIRGRIGCCWTR